jgi:hypothetical protein
MAQQFRSFANDERYPGEPGLSDKSPGYCHMSLWGAFAGPMRSVMTLITS